MNAKVTSIISYFFSLVGWLIAYFAGDREGAKFHLNQSLVLVISNVVIGVVSWIPVIGWIVSLVGGIFVFVCWILGLIAAVKQEEKEMPLLGKIKILK